MKVDEETVRKKLIGLYNRNIIKEQWSIELTFFH
jgi:hypothetical protein